MSNEDPFDGIIGCPIHTPPGEMDEQCGQCRSEFDAKQDVAKKIARDIQNRFNNFVSQGIQPPSDLIHGIRLETLIQTVMGPRARTHFEVESGLRLVEAMKDMQQQVTRERLAGSKRLVVPGT